MCMIKINLAKVIARIRAAEAKFDRVPNSVKLLPVSKTKPVSMLKEASTNWLFEFGENYLQDAIGKIKALDNTKITWHFIGHVQSNKAKQVAENFSWIHTVDSLKLALLLDKFRPETLPPLNVCIQINISSEPKKFGCDTKTAMDLAWAIRDLKKLKLRGLMTIPKPASNFTEQRKPFGNLKKIFDDLQNQGLDIDTLSMGMSNDLEAAIAEGSTMVRIGTDIFGPRT